MPRLKPIVWNIKVSELVALAKILDCEVGDFFKDLK